ncbi:XRE family transcriptional regulator [Sphaerisporangium album]|uniref:XRE family transcriptional regulator n=1 Tax=Sphaerisporangium album TaxID=509200 RepID=A0A367EVE0_9ACTN|nr:helix-turn-helix transcriptional regulator [Sphaerisporangium album]RCG21130.1 XRE family transcriptional regulator [Sphaerisporangium album]
MTHASPSAGPHGSPWHVLGAAIRHWREDVHGWGLRATAAHAHINHSFLARIERGERIPQLSVVADLDRILGAQGILIALFKGAETATQPVRPVVPAAATVDAEGMDEVRRQLLSGIAGLAVTAVAAPLPGLDQLREVVDARMGPASVSEWEETAWEYSHAVRARPLPQVIPDLALDLLALQKLLAAPGGRSPAWWRVNARMTFMLALAVGAAGQTRQSRHWWATARHAADRTSDGELIAVTNAYEAVHAVFEDRPASMIIARAEAALAAAAGRACAGAAEAYVALAQVHAMTGNAEAARQALEGQARLVDELPDTITGDYGSTDGWPVTRMLHARSFVHTYLGSADAGHAQQEALNAYPRVQTSYVRRQLALIRLHQTISAVRDGDVYGGLEQALDIVEGLPEQTIFVRRLASAAADAVPAADRSRRPVIDYRHRLALTSGE